MEEKIEAVQRMQDYIAEHLSETITLTALSSVSYYSPSCGSPSQQSSCGMNPVKL